MCVSESACVCGWLVGGKKERKGGCWGWERSRILILAVDCMHPDGDLLIHTTNCDDWMLVQE